MAVYTLQIETFDTDRTHALRYASPYSPLYGQEEIERICGAVHDVCKTWALGSGESGVTLTVPDVWFEHAVGAAVISIAEVRRERVLAEALSHFGR